MNINELKQFCENMNIHVIGDKARRDTYLYAIEQWFLNESWRAAEEIRAIAITQDVTVLEAWLALDRFVVVTEDEFKNGLSIQQLEKFNDGSLHSEIEYVESYAAWDDVDAQHFSILKHTKENYIVLPKQQ